MLKDGRTSAVNLPARTTPTGELVSRMTGRTIEYVFPPRRPVTDAGLPGPASATDLAGSGGAVGGSVLAQRAPAGLPGVAGAGAGAVGASGPVHSPTPTPPLLHVVGLTRPGEFADVSLTVHSGEIVGIAGLVGSGRSELLETIYGARRAAAGTVTVNGARLRPGAWGPRCGPASGWRRRSARARRCCSTSRSTAT